MSTLVRQTGLVSTSLRFDTRAALNLPDGTAVLVVHDPNTSGAPAGYGDGTGTEKIYVYSSSDRNNWTLRTTINSPLANPIRVTSNVAVDGTVGIVCWTTTAVRYISVPSTTWVAAAAQTPRSAISSPLVEDDWDIAFTDGNVPVIFALRSNTTGSTRLQLNVYIRRTSDSTWILTAIANPETNRMPATVYQSVSGVVLMTGGSPTARNLVVAAGHGNGQTDDGVDLYTCKVDETSGVVSAITLRKNYVAAEIPGTSTMTRARSVMLHPSDDNEYTIGIQHSDGKKRIGIAKGTYDGTTYVETVPLGTHMERGLDAVQYGMSMTYAAGRISYVYSTSTGALMSIIGHVDSISGAVSFSDKYYFDNMSLATSLAPLGGSGRFVEYITHDIVFINKVSATKLEFWHHYARPTRAPSGVIPGNGSTVLTAEPTLRANADLDLAYPQSLIKMQWEFAKDPAFATNEFIYTQTDDKYALVSGTNVTNVTVPFVDALPTDFAISGQGTWYVRAAHVDEYGVVGASSPTNSFIISHPPAAANIDPGGLSVRAYGAGVFLHDWVFTDPWGEDHQTAYRIVVDNLDTAATVGDTGKVASLVESGSIALPIGVKNATLRSSIQLWDADDVAGLLVAGTPWVTADAVGVTITSPAAGIINTAIPTISATVNFGGNRTVVKYKVDVIQTSNAAVVGSSGWLNTNLATGGSFSWQPPVELLANNTGYTFAVSVTDSWGIVSTPVTVAVTTTWTPPVTAAGVAVTVTTYNTEGMGWVLVSWQDIGRDPNFTAWVVYRKMDLIDPNTLAVLEEGDWEDIDEETTTAGSYQYYDYWAKSGYKVSYRVEQKVTRFGDVVISSNGVAKVNYPVSDSYWVIDPDDLGAWKLGPVTADSYNDEYEEAEYSVIGRGRKVDVGERIGYSGTLTAQLRDSPGLTARQKRIRLEELKKTQNRRLYLRNPFGDVFRVSVRAMQFTRIAGVGQSEFVDVSIPYSEVAE